MESRSKIHSIGRIVGCKVSNSSTLGIGETFQTGDIHGEEKDGQPLRKPMTIDKVDNGGRRESPWLEWSEKAGEGEKAWKHPEDQKLNLCYHWGCSWQDPQTDVSF